jgi:hypothetical protein
MSRFRVAALACAALVAGARAGSSAEAAATEAVALRVAEAPVVDGEVLEEPVWAPVPAATEFWQTTPDEGQPASERTEVRIVYTADALYFGIVCRDREPSRIVVADSRRDSPLDETDSFQIILDTYRDRQNGFVFGTNPAGIEYDGQVTKEGQGSDTGPSLQQSGSAGGFNLNWDAAWTVKTRLGPFGWSAEFAIPFRTLRYRGGGDQTWGLNFQRNIRRRNETAFWSRLPRQYTLFRLSEAGALRGLEVPPQRNLKLMPYVLGESRRDARSSPRTTSDADVGGDLKFGVTPSLTLDLTVNTDFAQVEVDEQQINLDRFNLFFPEKRPFFLENAGIFAVGSPGEVEMFFSRRIGIGPSGEIVPILAGGRVSGKLGAANVGVLNMQTRSVGGITPANNFTVARLSRELPNRSSIGALFVNRQATGAFAGEEDYNRTFSADGQWGIGRHGLITGYAARTQTPGISRGEHAYSAGATHDSQGWLLDAKYTEVGEGFNPEVGFLSRSDYRMAQGLVYRRHRPRQLLGLHEIRPHVSYTGYWKPGGFHESGFLHIDSHFEWKSGYEVHTGLNVTREGVQAPFEIFPGVVVPPGTYDHEEVQIVAMSNQGAPVSFDGTFTFGGFFGGHRSSLQPSAKARIGDAFTSEVFWDRNDIDLPWGRFVTNLLRARLSYSFTTRLFAQALVQYNDRIDAWSTNLRVGWLQSANTGLFVVYNENRDTAGVGVPIRDRSVVVKFSRLVDLLD